MNTNCKIVDYSEKSCAVIGDTKSIKDDLKQLGCKFNNNLMIDDEKVPGWIFSKKVRETIEKYLTSGVVSNNSNRFDSNRFDSNKSNVNKSNVNKSNVNKSNVNRFDSNNLHEELKKYVLKKDYDNLLERVKKLEEK